MFLLILNYIVTFIVFPGVTNFIKLTFMERDAYWHEIVFISIFNLFDTIGRFSGCMPNSLKISIQNIWGILGIRTLQIAPFIIFAFT